MRSLFALFLLPIVPAIPVHAQDGAALANQQIVQMQQSSQLAMQQQQQVQQMQEQQLQQQQLNTPSGAGVGYWVPKFSVKPGVYPGSITVKMKGAGAGYIYYTTDGWTPTAHSTPYTGPITISSTTRLQAVVIGAGGWRSLVGSVDYVIGNSPATFAAPAGTDGTPRVELVFTAPVKEKGLEVGDKLPVALAEDLRIGGAVVAPKGTPALATVTQAYGSSIGGAPGSISFAVHSVSAAGRTIRLSGTETKEGESKTRKLRKLVLIPGVGPAFALKHGSNPEIEQGAMLSAAIVPETVSSASTR